MKRRLLVALNSLIVLACLLGLWQAIVSLNHVPKYMLPGPLAVALAVRDRLPSLVNSLPITTQEAACGLSASIVVGVTVAMIFAQWRWMRQLVYPYTILLQTVSIVAIAPLIINWAGAGTFSVTVVTFIISLAPIIAMHTYNLLTAHADRSTIAAEGLVLLDAFLDRLRSYQGELRAAIAANRSLADGEKSEQAILEHFRLLQACDNLSLLTCVAFGGPANLLHPLPLNDGGTSEIQVLPVAERHFRLSPWPFAEPEMQFTFPARHVKDKVFADSQSLAAAFVAAPEERLTVTLSR